MQNPWDNLWLNPAHLSILSFFPSELQGSPVCLSNTAGLSFSEVWASYSSARDAFLIGLSHYKPHGADKSIKGGANTTGLPYLPEFVDIIKSKNYYMWSKFPASYKSKYLQYQATGFMATFLPDRKVIHSLSKIHTTHSFIWPTRPLDIW